MPELVGWLAVSGWNVALGLIGKVDPHTHNILAVITGAIGVWACLAALGMLRALQRRQVLRAKQLWR
jgi:hypothetical protein